MEGAVPGSSPFVAPPASVADVAVSAQGLVKRFDQKLAVAGIDLQVPSGSFFGLVGPNGAGKTTTIRMMTALLRPDAGRVTVAGIDVWSDPARAKAHMGVLPDEFRLFDRLTGAELLDYSGLLRGLPPDVVGQRASELLDVLDLRDAADTLIVDYSTGMRKKTALAAALLHAPPVLFLDEPFEAIDPVSTRTIRTVLERYTAAGRTVVFSSHVMEVVERLCDRLAVVDRGRIVAAGAIDEVRQGRRLEDVFVELVGGRDAGEGDLRWLGEGGDPPGAAPPPTAPPADLFRRTPTSLPPPPAPPPPRSSRAPSPPAVSEAGRSGSPEPPRR